MPLTDDGFLMPTRDDVKSSVIDKCKNRLGKDIDISPGSPFGMIVEAWTDDRMTEEQTLQDLYDSSFKSTSVGVSLDRLADNDGLQRYQAQYAEVQLTFTGESGYVVPANTEFDTENGDAYFTDVDVQLDSNGNGTVMARSEDASADANVAANTIIVQAQPVDEIHTVTNLNAATGGADLENDLSLRNRMTANGNSKEGPTDAGIVAATLNVPGVISADLQDNREDTTDKYGNPPHTYHLYVLGGNPPDIANKLATVIGAGTTMIGEQVFEEQVNGSTVEIRFDIAENVNIQFKIDVDTSAGYSEDALNQTVEDFISQLAMGDTIIINKLYGDLYSLSGIDKVNNIQASRDNNNWVNDAIQLGRSETAVTEDKVIEVTTHG